MIERMFFIKRFMVDNKNRDTTHRDCSLHLLIDKVPSTLIVIYVHYIYIFVALHSSYTRCV